MSEEEDWRLNDLVGEKDVKVWALRGVGGPENIGTPGASSPKAVLSEQGGTDSITHLVHTDGRSRLCVCRSRTGSRVGIDEYSQEGNLKGVRKVRVQCSRLNRQKAVGQKQQCGVRARLNRKNKHAK